MLLPPHVVLDLQDQPRPLLPSSTHLTALPGAGCLSPAFSNHQRLHHQPLSRCHKVLQVHLEPGHKRQAQAHEGETHRDFVPTSWCCWKASPAEPSDTHRARRGVLWEQVPLARCGPG